MACRSISTIRNDPKSSGCDSYMRLAEEVMNRDEV